MATIDTIANRSTGSAIAGKAYFETSTNKFIVFNGTAWIELDSDGVGAVYQNRWGASFDGSNDYLNLGSSSDFDTTSAFTISAWVNPTSLTNYEHVYSRFSSSHTQFYITPSGNLTLTVDRVSFPASTGTVSVGSWQHVAVSWQSGTGATAFYINGSPAGTGTNTGTLSTGTTKVAIGAKASANGNNFFNGLIEEVAVFDSALTDAEIASLVDSGKPAEMPSSLTPIGFYRMGDNSSDSATAGGAIATITDSSGNGNDAVQATASKQPTFKALAQSTTSVSFNNSSDYLEKTFSSAPCAGAYTIGFWFKSTVNMNYLSIFESSDTVGSYNGGIRIYRFGDGHIRLVSATTTGAWQAEVVSPANATNLDTWHHIVITRSANGVSPELYIDGVTPSGTSYGSPMNEAISSTKLRIGSTYDGGLTGYMDEVSFFNSELTGSDLTAYLTANRGAHLINDLSLSPTAYYRMGEDDSLTDGASVSQISDASGNGNHATQATASNQPTASVDPVIYV